MGHQVTVAPCTNSLGSTIQPVLNSVKTVQVQTMGCQIPQENAVGNSVKGFTEVQVENIHNLFLIH